jgi:fatty-acyl-CoA synthase
MATENLTDYIGFWARRWPEKPVAIDKRRALTWQQLHHSSERIAAGLMALGVKRGDAVGILLRNRVEFLEAEFGAIKSGAALALLNPRHTPREMAFPLMDARIKIVLTEAEFLPLFEAVRSNIDHAFLVYAVDADSSVRSFEDLAALEPIGGLPQLYGSDIAFICYTSGTTGRPKGAMLSHHAIFSGAVVKILATGQVSSDRLLMPLPLAYTGGAVGLIRDTILLGATAYLIDGDAGQYLDLIERERINHIAGVPVMFESLMNHPRFAHTNLSCVRQAVTGGATPSLRLLNTFHERGILLVQGYGLTEAGGSHVTLLFGEDAQRKLGFAGRPLPNIGVKVRRADDSPAAVDEPGEIWVHGPTLMSGYLNNPALTAEVLVDGWLKTGDVGFFDAEGYLKIVDRSKDMLISGGLNVYPAELERVLATVPGLKEFAVIGVPDTRWGEVPLMVVAQGLETLDLAGLRAFCERELADYKRPRYIVNYEQPLPRTFSGKIQKAVLRQHYQAVPEQSVDLKELGRREPV